MRILLVSSASYDPPKGGSTRSNLVWLRAMAASGDDCLVFCGSETGTDFESSHDGIGIRSIADLGRNTARIGEAVREQDPDFVLVSSEDLAHGLLREAQRVSGDRLIYLAHTPQWFPFGPEAWNPDEQATAGLRNALAIVAIGQHMAAYIEEHLGRKAQVVRPDLYGKGPWKKAADFSAQSALLINACTVKGLPIFLELARRQPEIQFLALKGWGTTAADVKAMLAQPNVRVLETVASIDEAFGQAAVLLAPSLWYEGFGLVVTEAMLRGLPVLASNHGGLSEAAADSRFRLPIKPIGRWLARFDETGMPEAEIEPQPIEAWAAALESLLRDPVLYEAESGRVRQAAEKFVVGIDAADLRALLSGLKPRGRKILLIHNSTYYPGHGGGDKSNRLLVEALAKAGHELRVFTRLEAFGESEEAKHRAELEKRGVAVRAHAELGLEFELGGAEVVVVTRGVNLRRAILEELETFQPEIILASTDDPAHLLLETALRYTKARLVYLVRATIALPFGPDASSPSEERTERLRRADAMVCVSEYVAEYCRNYGGFNAVHVPISLADDANPPLVGRFDNPYVTLVNPSAVKGLPILLQLADALPQVKFAAVPSWGTTEEDLAAMRKRGNIKLLETVDDITEILAQSRVTLVPSLWAEARSRMVLESLARGVPVLASDVGGLREAMCGVDYVLPVNPIVSYRTAVSDQMVPEAEVPAQNIGPWKAALELLTTEETAWAALSAQGRTAALAYLRSLTVQPLERMFRMAMALPAKSSDGQTAAIHLSGAKRKLLGLRLRAAKAARLNRYFLPQPGQSPRVFLFPWAAAGGQAWNFLRPQLGEHVRMMAAVLPGREGRVGEEFAQHMNEMTGRIVDEMEPLMADAYVLAGHSMGGIIAFEVAREISKRGLRLPAGLVISSCRAPHLRRLDPLGEIAPDSELVQHVEREELLPLLRADLKLFHEYDYHEAASLPIPMRALLGDAEPALAAWQMEGWARETSLDFKLQLVPGGHFWLKEHPMEFSSAILQLLRL